MEPHNAELKKAPELLREASKSRLQILKLEERIAPACHLNPQGDYVGCGGPDHYRGR